MNNQVSRPCEEGNPSAEVLKKAEARRGNPESVAFLILLDLPVPDMKVKVKYPYPCGARELWNNITASQ